LEKPFSEPLSHRASLRSFGALTDVAADPKASYHSSSGRSGSERSYPLLAVALAGAQASALPLARLPRAACTASASMAARSSQRQRLLLCTRAMPSGLD
jgi:hypothetical protein